MRFSGEPIECSALCQCDMTYSSPHGCLVRMMRVSVHLLSNRRFAASPQISDPQRLALRIGSRWLLTSRLEIDFTIKAREIRPVVSSQAGASSRLRFIPLPWHLEPPNVFSPYLVPIHNPSPRQEAPVTISSHPASQLHW